MWGGAAITFTNAIVVVDDERLADSVTVKGRRVERIGGGPKRGDVTIDLDGAVVYPGLVNAHDHLELNSFPRMKWREHHANVREWIADFQPHFATDGRLAAARPETLTTRVWVGGLKNLLSGVTTVCHHNPLHRPLAKRFPVRVVRRFGLSHSLQIDGDRVASDYRKTPPDWPWIIHAAEGIDEEARGEVPRLGRMGCLGVNTVLVHGVAIDEERAATVLERGGGLVWCPTSNQFLFGRTAKVAAFSHAGRLAIGSDSRLSGEGDLLDEIRAARATRQISAQSLFRAVTSGAGRMLRQRQAGTLRRGVPADLAVTRRVAEDPYESLARATRADVRMTMIDGTPLVADPALAGVFAARRAGFRRARVDGLPRLLARWIADRASALEVDEPGLLLEA
jgi:cytosine/adenosine deaminase-related metal-dependent hydrolase